MYFTVPNPKTKKERMEQIAKNKIFPFWCHYKNMCIAEKSKTVELETFSSIGLFIVFLVFLAATFGSALILSTTTGFFERTSFSLNLLTFFFIIYLAYSCLEMSEVCASILCMAPAWYLTSDVLAPIIFHVKVKKLNFTKFTILYLISMTILVLITKLLVFYRKQWRLFDLEFFQFSSEANLFDAVYQLLLSAAVMSFGAISGFVFSRRAEKKNYFTIMEFWNILVNKHLVRFIVLTIILFIVMLLVNAAIRKVRFRRRYARLNVGFREHEEQCIIETIIAQNIEDYTLNEGFRTEITRLIVQKIHAMRKAYEKYDSEKHPYNGNWNAVEHLPEILTIWPGCYENEENEKFYRLTDEELHRLYNL